MPPSDGVADDGGTRSAPLTTLAADAARLLRPGGVFAALARRLDRRWSAVVGVWVLL